MPIKYVKGDLFTTKDYYIAHGCNAYGAFGAGVAKVVKEKYPGAYEAYRDYCMTNEADDIMGTVWPHMENDKCIFNIITQKSTGDPKHQRNVDYEAVANGFHGVFTIMMLDGKGTRLSIPKIGAGLAGGDWNVIEAIIKSKCPNTTTVTVWEL